MIAITATLTEGATLVGAVFYPHGASGGTCYYAFDAYAGYDLAPLLQHSATRSVVAVDNAMGQLHDDTPSGFADWASATLDAPVGVFKVEASSSGRWPGNPNIVAEWETYKVTGQSGLLGFQFVAVEPYNLAWALAKSSSDGPPAQRIVVLHAVPLADGSGNIISFPFTIPNAGSGIAYSNESHNAEPTYDYAVSKIAGQFVQYTVDGQWTQWFSPTPAARVVYSKVGGTPWSAGPAPFDGIAPVTVVEWSLINESANDIEARFGTQGPAFTVAGNSTYVLTIPDHAPLTVDRSSQLQVKGTAGDKYRVTYRFASAGGSGCGCGGAR